MKHTQHTHLLLLANAGMEICWLFALANLIMMSLTNRMFPLPEAITAFALAMALTHIAHGRGWPRIVIIGIQAVGFTLVGLRLVYAFSYHSSPFFSPIWLKALFTPPGTPLDWLILMLVVFLTLIFWIGGMKLARRAAGYWDICRRFDFGFGMLCGLLLIKIVLTQSEVYIRDLSTGWFIVPFFLFGLLAIGLARNRYQTRTTYLAGHRTIGIVLSFAILILIAGIGLSSLFWPYFVLAAEVGYDLLQQGLIPAKTLLVGILTFLFRGSLNVTYDTVTSENYDVAGGIASGKSSSETDFLETIFEGGLGSLLILAGLVLGGFALWHLFRWLFSATPADKVRVRQSDGFLAWLLKLPGILFFCWEWIYRRLRSSADAVQIYSALLHWGQYSGIPHGHTETPLEYGMRLSWYFPVMQPEIMLITDLFQQEIYAELPLDAQQFKRVHLALQRLRSPLHWPARLRSRFRSME